MGLTKFAKAYKKSKAHQGAATEAHVLKNLTAKADVAVLQTLTTKQLTEVINALNYGYHDGVANYKKETE